MPQDVNTKRLKEYILLLYKLFKFRGICVFSPGPAYDDFSQFLKDRGFIVSVGSDEDLETEYDRYKMTDRLISIGEKILNAKESGSDVDDEEFMEMLDNYDRKFVDKV